MTRGSTMVGLGATLAGMSLAFASPASAAASDAAQRDVQCLLLSNMFSKTEKDPKLQQTAVMTHFFYLGRLSREAIADDLPAAMEAARKAITPALAGPTMQACAKAVMSSQTDVEQAGKRAQAAQGR